MTTQSRKYDLLADVDHTHGQPEFCTLLLPVFSSGGFEMKMTRGTNVPPGKYRATFKDARETTHAKYGPGACWTFVLGDGEHAGATVCRTTKTVATKSNTCGRFWEMVSGLPLDDAIKYDTDEWVNTPGMIVLEDAPEGDSMRVVEFVRDDSTQSSDEAETTS